MPHPEGALFARISKDEALSVSWFETAQERLLAMRSYFTDRLLALIAAATRLTGGRPIRRLISLVAATSLGMSTPVATPMPSSI